MALVEENELLEKIIYTNIDIKQALISLVDKKRGNFNLDEGLLLDYKLMLDINKSSSIAEIGRDILGFANTKGGLILLGVNNEKRIVGHDEIDSKKIRQKLGPYVGTRVEFEIGCVHIPNVNKKIVYILIGKSLKMYPLLLRKEIELTPLVFKKVKYKAGSIFYRKNDEIRVVSPHEDIDSVAKDLGFRGSAPRTSSSFLFEEDRPGLRLFKPLNEKFFGREDEINEIVSKYSDPRGKGVSLCGLGGVGKTELAIKITSELWRLKKFSNIYSGSAKKTLLSNLGTQLTDPYFYDYPSFLIDLGAWLGNDFNSSTPLEKMESECVVSLKAMGNCLLFVDNLETIEDRRLFEFLENKLPGKCWLLTTSRVHRVRNFIYQKQVDPLDSIGAAKMLRYELKNQGLEKYANLPIENIKKHSDLLGRHPLVIRCFAWKCKKNELLWEQEVKSMDLKNIESFCIGDTLDSLSTDTTKVFCSIAAVSGQIFATAECIEHICEIQGGDLEESLFELESSGLIVVNIDSETGQASYQVVLLAENMARELCRIKNWESSFVMKMKRFEREIQGRVKVDPLVRDLINLHLPEIRSYQSSERRILIERVNKALTRRLDERLNVLLYALKGECERHENNTITAGDDYKKAADYIISKSLNALESEYKEKMDNILLEAATVARSAGGKASLKRGLIYLEQLHDNSGTNTLRLYGMLTEFNAKLKNKSDYEKYKSKLELILNDASIYYSAYQIENATVALIRAENSWKDD